MPLPRVIRALADFEWKELLKIETRRRRRRPTSSSADPSGSRCLEGGRVFRPGLLPNRLYLCLSLVPADGFKVILCEVF